MLNEERRRAILESVNREGRVLVGELAHQFDTSEVTIRKDLEILHAKALRLGSKEVSIRPESRQ